MPFVLLLCCVLAMNSEASAQNETYTYYLDSDGDGFGTDSSITSTSAAPPPGYAWRPGDCNDSDASINPYVPEIPGNDIDENCDGRLDEPTCLIYYDNDRDGYGDPATQISIPCDIDIQGSGYVRQCDDCDDNNRNVHPGAAEICGNGIDDNCDGVIDNCGATYYYDGDGDGYGLTDSYITSTSAVPPEGYAVLDGDCNDNDASVNPGAAEICDNGVDDNCDGVIDNCVFTYYIDNDVDGYGGDYSISIADSIPPAGYTAMGGDCIDYDNSIHPGATETCNGMDDNCDGQIDEGCPTYTYYIDGDGDGYGGDYWIDLTDSIPPQGYTITAGDCVDYDSSIHPGAIEICNGIDDNCDGVIDTGCIKEQLPDFTKTDIYGVSHHFYGDLAAGKAVVIEFSTGWCPFTQVVEPQISNVYDDICQGQGNIKLYDIVFENEVVGYESDSAFGVKYANLHNAIYPVITNSKNVFNQFSYAYSLTSIPTFLVVIPDATDPAKSAVHIMVGAIGNLKDSIENILATHGFAVSPPPVLSISVNGSACNLPSPVTLTSNISSEIVWSTGETTQSITVTTEGDYSLNYTAGCGTITKKVHLAKPVTGILTSLTETACAGKGLIALEYDGGTAHAMLQYSTDGINWADFLPDFQGGRTFLDPYPAGTTVYFRVHETISGNGDISPCEAYSNIVQILNEEMTTPGFEIAANGTDCSFPVTLTSPYPGNNLWSTGETTQSITVNSPDTYYVINSDVCGEVADLIIVDQVTSTWYRDADEDGYGDPLITTQACTQPAGYVQDNNDCNDSDAGTHPGAPEICDGVDNNCDGQADEGFTKMTYYRDADGDGYGNPNDHVQNCNQPPGYVRNNTDCNDNNANVYPKVFYHDADSDGYGNPNDPVIACTKPVGYVTNKKDCNDNNATVYPGAPEICGDGIDNNCNGKIDENCILLSIADISVVEKPKAQRAMNFQVTLNKKSAQTVTVNYTTQDGTAHAGSDYAAQSGTVTFNPGIKEVVISITIDGDKISEPDETFTVLLSNPVNAALNDGVATGTIINHNPAAFASSDAGENISDTANAFAIIPNPASYKVNISVTSYRGNITIHLSDEQGKMLQEKKLESLMTKLNQTTLDVSRYTNGIYFITVFDDKGNNKTQKLIIQR